MQADRRPHVQLVFSPQAGPAALEALQGLLTLNLKQQGRQPGATATAEGAGATLPAASNKLEGRSQLAGKEAVLQGAGKQQKPQETERQAQGPGDGRRGRRRASLAASPAVAATVSALDQLVMQPVKRALSAAASLLSPPSKRSKTAAGVAAGEQHAKWQRGGGGGASPAALQQGGSAGQVEQEGVPAAVVSAADAAGGAAAAASLAGLGAKESGQQGSAQVAAASRQGQGSHEAKQPRQPAGSSGDKLQLKTPGAKKKQPGQKAAADAKPPLALPPPQQVQVQRSQGKSSKHQQQAPAAAAAPQVGAGTESAGGQQAGAGAGAGASGSGSGAGGGGDGGSGRQCNNCRSHSTTGNTWRKDPNTGACLCNPCGQFYTRHKRHRSAEEIAEQELKNAQRLEERVCTNCGATETGMWRRHPETRKLLCNHCGNHVRQHGSLPNKNKGRA